MRMYEGFTRCKCGEALIERKELVTANYDNQTFANFGIVETRVEYRCTKCNTLIHKETITES